MYSEDMHDLIHMSNDSKISPEGDYVKVEGAV